MLQLVLNVGPDTDAGLVADILLDLGALSATITDRNEGTSTEQPLFHIASPNDDGNVLSSGVLIDNPPTLWSDAIVDAYFPPDASLEQVTMSLFSNFDLPSTPLFSIANAAPVPQDILEKDWVLFVHSNFSAITIGSLRVRAPWHDDDECDNRDHKFRIILEPGQAFGTGEHPTTQLVASFLEEHANTNVDTTWSCLDYGTGSGILAIAAVLMGASSAVGCDIDSRAVSTAVENAKTNRCDDRIEFGTNEFEQERFDEKGAFEVVVANILASPLKSLAPLLSTRIAPGGKIALSGILLEQAIDVSDAFSSQGLTMENATLKAGWVLLVGTKPHAG
jgi:ribosomal protein L11 methyltransferase